MSDDQLSLFRDLPDQVAPWQLYADRHVLEICRRCGGSGREADTSPPEQRGRWGWNPTCRGGCGGQGGWLRAVEAGRDG